MVENQNLRMTRQRQVILEELRKVKTHPSADELYEKVKKRLPRISLGTVYRNLEILTRLGEIQHVEIGGAMKRFDGNPRNHYHIRCLGCARVDDLAIDPLKQVEDALSGRTDYRITGHRLEFVGLCRKCLKKTS
ncbi:MAG: transcriptional repressor [Thermodesulfobacteriota bacterium]